jgi:phospholipase C
MWATGTSCNLATNPISGCTQGAFTQPTIFDSLNHSKVSYKMYSNSTNGACAAEAGLEGVARHKHSCFSQGEFYKDAAAGTLPAYSFVSPPGEACDHPVRTRDSVHASQLLSSACRLLPAVQRLTDQLTACR